MVYRKIGLFKNWSKLKLIGRHLIMACLNRNAQFGTFFFQFAHKAQDPCWDYTKIVIVQLLTFGRKTAHQGPSCYREVHSGIDQCLIYQKVFLLPT